MAGRYRLTGGSHTRENGERIVAGETFEPTAEERDGPLRRRVVRERGVHLMPEGLDRIDWSDDGSGDA